VKRAIADGKSRHFHSQDTEWMLNPEPLTGALKTLNFEPEIDLFASRLNKQLLVYCSYRPDPGPIRSSTVFLLLAVSYKYCRKPFRIKQLVW